MPQAPARFAAATLILLAAFGCHKKNDDSAWPADPPGPPAPAPVAVFKATGPAVARDRIYVANDDGSGLLQLDGLVPGPAITVGTFTWSPDHQQVAFTHNAGASGIPELYVVPVTGGTVVNVSGPIAAGIGVQSALWSPDHAKIAYRAITAAGGPAELFVTTPAGGPGIKVSGAMVAGGNVGFSYNWAPDSSRVAYIADQVTDTVDELFTSDATGAGSNVKISGALVAGGDVQSFDWAPDSSRVAYLADQATDAVNELYTSTPTSAASNVKINGALVAGGSLSGSWDWAPDGSRILYIADQVTDNQNELFTSLPTGAAGNVKINGALAVPGSDVTRAVWLPNSSRIVYMADQAGDQFFELYSSSPTTAVGNVRISGATVSAGGVLYFRVAPDSLHVAYETDQDTLGVVELYVTSTTAAASVKVSGPMVAGGGIDILQYAWTPDSSRIVYQADQDTDGVMEFYSSLSTGGGNIKLNKPLVAGGNVSAPFQVTSDGGYVVYDADADSDGVNEVYCAKVGVAGSSVKLNGTLIAGGQVLGVNIR